MKLSKIRFIAYTISALSLLIPTLIMLVSDTAFSNLFIDLIIVISFTLFSVGKSITVIEKKKDNKYIAFDVGLIVGVMAVLITRFFK